MKVSSSKEKILKKIREALSNPVPLPFPKSEGSKGVFPPPDKELEMLFAEEFIKLSGKFAFCLGEKDAKNQLKILFAQQKWTKIYSREKELVSFFDHSLDTEDLHNCDAAITSCHYLVARTGALLLSSAQDNGRTASVYAPVHICIAYTDQLVFDTRDALNLMKENFGNKLPSSITFAAGPSRTADIEKTLVIGIHGPKEVYVFLIDRQFSL
ncbi:MAG: lactate utilization protein [Ginsengibacter sp.]|jgi:L-lactate dehydrogenase complex protein LldG